MGNQAPKQLTLQKYEDVILKRTEKSYHNLYSPRDLHKEFIWKKWKFCSRDKAEQQLAKLHYKMNNPSNFMISVQDVQFTKTSSQNFKIRAKVQFSEKNLKSFIEDRISSLRDLSMFQIWNLTTQICQIAKYTKEYNHEFPEDLSSFLLFDNKIKIKDCSLLPQIKSENPSIKQSIRNTISRIVVNLSLLLLENGQVPIYEINRINLKYNVNLATFVYCLKEELSIEEIIKLCENLSQENRELVYKSVTMGYENKYQITSCQSNSGQNLLFPLKHKEYLSQHKDRLTKCTSQNTLPPNSKRIQQMKPKNHCKMRLVFDNQQKNKVENKESKENKENIDGNNNLNKIKQQQQKPSLQIQNHSFPKKFKQFKRVSTAASDMNDSKNFDSKNSSARNQAFIKMTGGSKCELFSQDQNDELLQSIIESEQSIIIKDNESPLLSLDQQMDQITQDFLKLQNSFNTVEKQEIKSVMQFAYQRNSTIMELTQQNEESGQEKVQDSRIQSRSHDVSKFQIEQGEQQQEKFVIEQYEGGSRYEGYLRNGLRNGFGKLYYEDGGSYQGAWKNGEIEGFGKLYYQSGDLAYEGNWLQGQFHGEGKIINQKPEQIVGSYHYPDFSQVGTAWTWYEGNFEHDQKSGKGTLMLSNGEWLSSTWSKNNVDGFGIFKTIDNRQIRGRWKNNILELVYEEEVGQFDNIQIP